MLTYLSLVNQIKTEPFGLGPSNLVHMLAMTRGQHVLLFKTRDQRVARSHIANYNVTFFLNSPVAHILQRLRCSFSLAAVIWRSSDILGCGERVPGFEPRSRRRENCFSTNDVAIDVANCALPGKVMLWSHCPEVRTLTNENGRFHNEIKWYSIFNLGFVAFRTKASSWSLDVYMLIFTLWNIFGKFTVMKFMRWILIKEKVRTFGMRICTSEIFSRKSGFFVVFLYFLWRLHGIELRRNTSWPASECLGSVRCLGCYIYPARGTVYLAVIPSYSRYSIDVTTR